MTTRQSFEMIITRIPISSLKTGGSEQETQTVIDLLQGKGWNCFWGTGQCAYCSDAEHRAFEHDFNEALEICKEYKGK